MKTLECLALNEELTFYRSCYAVQKGYIESVLNSFKAKYTEFTEHLKKTLESPLRVLIEKFWQMKNETTEVNLKAFLELFKQNSLYFNEILEKLEDFPKNNLIDTTFEQIQAQMNNQINFTNDKFSEKLKNFRLTADETHQMCTQSDELLSEILTDLNFEHTDVNSTNESSKNEHF